MNIKYRNTAAITVNIGNRETEVHSAELVNSSCDCELEDEYICKVACMLVELHITN